MSGSEHQSWFEKSASSWICDGYSVDIRIVAVMKEDKSWSLRGAALEFYPKEPARPIKLDQAAGKVRCCFVQLPRQPKANLLRLIEGATAGRVDAFGETFTLPVDQHLGHYSDSVVRERWHWTLDLRVLGATAEGLSAIALAEAEAAMRRATVPFDGIQDVMSSLGLPDVLTAHRQAQLSVSIKPPADLIFERSSLKNKQLLLTLAAHANFDRSRLGVAIRWLPGNEPANRFQAADHVSWSVGSGDTVEGTLRMQLTHANSFLTMLTIDQTAIRRQWFNDYERAPNERFVAMSQFDRDLRMLKHALLETHDAGRFEKAVAASLFLLGFSSAQTIETNAPDIILCTPSGQIVIVECTIRLADVGAKLGKLVDRRTTLQKALQHSSHPFPVVAVLVCRQSRDQLVQAKDFDQNQVILVGLEQMEAAIHRLPFRSDPDKLIGQALADLRKNLSAYD